MSAMDGTMEWKTQIGFTEANADADADDAMINCHY